MAVMMEGKGTICDGASRDRIASLRPTHEVVSHKVNAQHSHSDAGPNWAWAGEERMRQAGSSRSRARSEIQSRVSHSQGFFVGVAALTV